MCAAPAGEPTISYARVSWLFQRALALVYLFAFWSLGTQIRGLVGHDGILPADEYLASARSLSTVTRLWLLPTLAWINTSDVFLQALTIAGAALAIVLLAGILPVVVMPLLWVLYLSLSVVGAEFLSYQWDALLLETGLLACLLAPCVWLDRPRALHEPPRLARWLLQYLLFRLMVGSGAVKLMSGDPTWRNLTALAFHFETQPIPTPLAWYVHLLPFWLLKAATALSLIIELAAPLAIFAPRRVRIIAFALLAGLQVAIALTGNYAFFNLLTIALSLFLLDDVALGGSGSVAQAIVSRGRRMLTAAVAIATVPVATLAFSASLGIAVPGAVLISPLVSVVEPFRSVNAYGLFAVMTTTRPEIVVEGSLDGTTWQPYEFKYKAGDVHRRPPWVAPHQPRLDWQMWFAALGRFQDENWFHGFCRRLLEGDAQVLELLQRDPFDGARPKFVRAVLYNYRFADASPRAAEGAWWTRERLGDYSPVLSLVGPPQN